MVGIKGLFDTRISYNRTLYVFNTPLYLVKESNSFFVE